MHLKYSSQHRTTAEIESSEDLSQMVVDKPRVDTPRYVSSPNVASVTQYAVGTQERDPVSYTHLTLPTILRV